MISHNSVSNYKEHFVYDRESLAVLRAIQKQGLNIATAISFTFKGVYFLPNFADPSSPKVDEFMLYKKCANFSPPHFDDPNKLCGNPDWRPVLPEMAYSLKQRRTMTYLTMSTIATLGDPRSHNLNVKDYRMALPCENQVRYPGAVWCGVVRLLLHCPTGSSQPVAEATNHDVMTTNAFVACDAKQFHLGLSFGLAAYDVDSDRAAPCKELGFKSKLSSYGRVVKLHQLMEFLRDSYKRKSDNSVCKSLFSA
ncbi:hypothetical protein HPB50_010844 [Hyalomma asiaticum]|uniref:Uncharacterized protein n=1 Tax=Hyalomma asiaticum TaxID=266040 RepID=A0ACB7RQT7_HYAAI|nr:hypothetical protein HPB50_010844 [Hyalomma asiaticum]